MRVELNIICRNGIDTDKCNDIASLICKYDRGYTREIRFSSFNGDYEIRFKFNGVGPHFTLLEFKRELNELDIYIDDDYPDCYYQVWTINATYIPKKHHDTFTCAVEIPQSIIDVLTGVKPSWFESFDIYFGEERKTGRHKVIVKWADGTKTEIYKTDDRPVPTVYALSYAWVKRAYGTNSAWKRLVDKHTTHFTYAMDIFEYDTFLYGKSLRIQASKNTKSKSAIDIYDEAAFMLVSQFYGGVAKLNDMIKEAVCENVQ